ncbi:MAG: ParB/RepB/Spo0J family partition protein [Chloroflexota bacterium]|nr:ParB/RepB/Spo0J family partition protein [Chloroflexota bacterium]
MVQEAQLYRGLDNIPLDQIDIPELNVRRREVTADLEELAVSIEKYGLQQPIVVMPKGDRFSVVIGQRRYLAFRHLDRSRIPALVLNSTLDPLRATLLSFSENIQRRDLSARDKAATCSALMNSLGSVKQVAEELGISQQTVRKWLGYAGVPDSIKEYVTRGGLTVDQARRIWTFIEDESTAVAIAQEIAKEPIKENRERILDSAKDLPGRSTSAILRLAAERKEIRRINFELTDSEARAMDEATQNANASADDLAKTATVDWLEENRYLRT